MGVAGQIPATLEAVEGASQAEEPLPAWHGTAGAAAVAHGQSFPQANWQSGLPVALMP